MKTKIWIWIGVILGLLGALLFAAAMTANRWDFTALGNVTFKTSEYEFGDTIRDISVTVTDAEIVFSPADEEKCRVVVYEREDEPHTVTVSDGTLSVKANDEREWFDHIGVNVGSPKVTVYLPEKEYGALKVRGAVGAVLIPSEFTFESADFSVTTGKVEMSASVENTLKIHTTTGLIRAEKVSARDIELSVTTGLVKMTDVTCENAVKITVTTGETEIENLTCVSFASDGSTGDITLKTVKASEIITVERSTGDVKIDGSDAPALSLKTTTGDISGSLLTDKIYNVKTSTGNISVPDSRPGGTCEIRTSTGNVFFR